MFNTPEEQAAAEPAAGDVLVITREDAAVCGTLTGQDEKQIQVRRQGKTTSTPINVPDVVSAVAVPKCPK
jgi:hypothetical protein